jgi:hypothetical protein
MRETRKTLAPTDIEPAHGATTGNPKQASEEAIPGQRALDERLRHEKRIVASRRKDSRGNPRLPAKAKISWRF